MQTDAHKAEVAAGAETWKVGAGAGAEQVVSALQHYLGVDPAYDRLGVGF